jgi:hypothetical protein
VIWKTKNTKANFKISLKKHTCPSNSPNKSLNKKIKSKNYKVDFSYYKKEESLKNINDYTIYPKKLK